MKFRSDFVTNSSSSSYAIIHVKTDTRTYRYDGYVSIENMLKGNTITPEMVLDLLNRLMDSEVGAPKAAVKNAKSLKLTIAEGLESEYHLTKHISMSRDQMTILVSREVHNEPDAEILDPDGPVFYNAEKSEWIKTSSGWENKDKTVNEVVVKETPTLTPADFPIIVKSTIDKYLKGWEKMNECIEHISVGDKLILRRSPRDSIISLFEVFNTQGEKLGEIQYNTDPRLNRLVRSWNENEKVEIQYGYLFATVESVTPLSQRRQNAKYAAMTVRLEYIAPS